MSEGKKLLGLLLCGGQSSRMGTRKETLQWHGEPERQRLSGLLAQVTEQVFFSQQEKGGDEVIVDGELGFGPLAGIYAAHQRFPEADWFVLSCDLPLVDLDHLKQLLTAFEKGTQSLAFESRFDGKSEPLCALYKAEDLVKIPAFFADENEHHCARCFFKSLPDKALIRPQVADAIDNCNTPGDKRDIEIRLKHGRGEIKLQLEHFAQLEAAIGLTKQEWKSYSRTAHGVWEELKMKYRMKSIDSKVLRPVINDELVGWDAIVKEGDQLSFLPPFAGG